MGGTTTTTARPRLAQAHATEGEKPKVPALVETRIIYPPHQPPIQAPPPLSATSNNPSSVPRPALLRTALLLLTAPAAPPCPAPRRPPAARRCAALVWPDFANSEFPHIASDAVPGLFSHPPRHHHHHPPPHPSPSASKHPTLVAPDVLPPPCRCRADRTGGACPDAERRIPAMGNPEPCAQRGQPHITCSLAPESNV